MDLSTIINQKAYQAMSYIGAVMSGNVSADEFLSSNEAGMRTMLASQSWVINFTMDDSFTKMLLINYGGNPNPDWNKLLLSFPNSVSSAPNSIYSNWDSSDLQALGYENCMASLFDGNFGVSPQIPPSVTFGDNTSGPFPYRPPGSIALTPPVSGNYKYMQFLSSFTNQLFNRVWSNTNIQGNIYSIISTNLKVPPQYLSDAGFNAIIESNDPHSKLMRTMADPNFDTVMIGSTPLIAAAGQAVRNPGQQTTQYSTVSITSSTQAEQGDTAWLAANTAGYTGGVGIWTTNYNNLGLYYFMGDIDLAVNAYFETKTTLPPSVVISVTIYSAWATVGPDNKLQMYIFPVASNQATSAASTGSAQRIGVTCGGYAVNPTQDFYTNGSPVPYTFLGTFVTYSSVTSGIFIKDYINSITLDTTIRYYDNDVYTDGRAQFSLYEECTGPFKVTGKDYFAVVPNDNNYTLLAAHLQKTIHPDMRSIISNALTRVYGVSGGVLLSLQEYRELVERVKDKKRLADLMTYLAVNDQPLSMEVISRAPIIEDHPLMTTSGKFWKNLSKTISSGIGSAPGALERVRQLVDTGDRVMNAINYTASGRTPFVCNEGGYSHMSSSGRASYNTSSVYN